MPTTTNWVISTWIHDADYDPAPTLREICEQREQKAANHEFGLCCDCEVGIDHREDFFVDNRDWSGTYQICNACYIRSFGIDAYHETVRDGQRGEWSRW